MVDIWLLIPIGPRLNYVDSVVRNSQLAPDRIIIVKDKQTRNIDKAINLERQNELNIQLWWQIGIEYAEKRGARYVAILSDDVRIIPGQLQIMLQELIQSKVAMISSKVSKKYGWGHAFIIDLKSGLRPDTRFSWYYGDYDLKYQAKKKGGYLVSTQEIEHLEPGKITKKSKDLEWIAIEDRKKFRRKYPIKTSLVWALNSLIAFGNLFRWNPFRLIVKLVDKFESLN